MSRDSTFPAVKAIVQVTAPASGETPVSLTSLLTAAQLLRLAVPTSAFPAQAVPFSALIQNRDSADAVRLADSVAAHTAGDYITIAAGSTMEVVGVNICDNLFVVMDAGTSGTLAIILSAG